MRFDDRLVDGWEMGRLGALVEIFDGPHATPKKTDDGPLFLGISCLDKGRLNLSDVAHISERDFVTWTRRVTPRERDVVFSYETRLGEAAQIPSGLRCCLGRRMGLLRVKSEALDPGFLLYAYLGPQFQQVIRYRTIPGSTVDRIPLKEMGDFTIVLPPREEQERIAAVLAALDDKIDSNRRLAKLLEETAATLFRARFVDFVGVEEFEASEIGPIPAGWKRGVIRDLVRLRYGKALRAADRTPGRVAVVGSSGIIGTHTSHLVEGPAIVIGRKGLPGSVIWVGRDAWPIDTTFFAEPADGVHGSFLYFMLRQADLAHLTADTGVPGLNRDAAEQHAVLVPSSDAVSDFASVADPLFRQRDLLNDEGVTLATLRDALLSKLISGQIRVPDADDVEEVIGSAGEQLAAGRS
jgi:type I restriction enzyme S subunit